MSLMPIAWCATCHGIAHPSMRTSKGRVHWRCYNCAPGYELPNHHWAMPEVQVMQDMVEKQVWKRWQELEVDEEVRLMETGELDVYTRERFFETEMVLAGV